MVNLVSRQTTKVETLQTHLGACRGVMKESPGNRADPVEPWMIRSSDRPMVCQRDDHVRMDKPGVDSKPQV